MQKALFYKELAQKHSAKRGSRGDVKRLCFYRRLIKKAKSANVDKTRQTWQYNKIIPRRAVRPKERGQLESQCGRSESRLRPLERQTG